MDVKELAKRVGATRAWHEFSEGWNCHRFCFAFGDIHYWLKAKEGSIEEEAFEQAEREIVAHVKSLKQPSLS